MAVTSSMLHVRLNADMKAQATDTLAAMGLTTADAVRLLFHRIVADQAFPLELKVPNTATRTAMAEALAVARDSKSSFSTTDELFTALEKPSRTQARTCAAQLKLYQNLL
jgi:DNA-damage-inducible protein J